MSQQPGHYYAEGDPPDTVRYWDGTQWVGDPQPAPSAAPPPPVPSTVPPLPAVAGQREIVSKMDRFLCYLLEIALVIVTLGIGWLIWALVIVLKNEGQTPAKKLMNQQALIEATGEPAGPARMIFVRGIAASLVLAIAQSLLVVPALILLLLVFFDDQNRTFWERLSSTVVVRT